MNKVTDDQLIEASRGNEDDAKSKPTIPRIKEKIHKIKTGLVAVEDIAFLPDNRLVVGDRVRKAVSIYDDRGAFVRDLVRGVKPYGIIYDGSQQVVVFVDSYGRGGCRRRIKAYYYDRDMNVSLAYQWGEHIDWMARGIAMPPQGGNLIVTDLSKGSHRIHTYTSRGMPCHSFGGCGSSERHFHNPYFVHVDEFNRILVSDRDNHSVKIYKNNARFSFLGEFGNRRSDSSRETLNRPRGVCTDDRGNIYVCDSGNRRVCVFTSSGHYVRDLLTKKHALGYPTAIAFNPESARLAVVQKTRNHDSSRVRKIGVYQVEHVTY